MYSLRCDIAACGKELESGAGQPSLASKRAIYCERCAGHVAAVDAEIRRRSHEVAQRGYEDLQRQRAELMASMLPPQLGGTGEGARRPEVAVEQDPA